MRLGFYYHIPSNKEDNEILMPGYLGRFIDSLAYHVEVLILFQHLPNPGENVNLDYIIQNTNVKLVSLPPRGSVPNRVIHSQKYTKILQENLSTLDALLVRGPTPLLPPMVKAAGEIPTILLLVGDYLAGVESLPQPWWRKELIRLWSYYNQQKQLKVAKNSLVFVNSQALYQKYEGAIKHLEQTRTTTLTQDDFYVREDTCQVRPIHLLYTGRMDPAKGLLDMVEALGILVSEGEDLILDLVGWPEEGSDILLRLDEAASKIGVKDRIFYHGYKAVGLELFAYYKKSDIYIIASQSSFEGFPRTIWEAMAHSLPVVATKVGSIPYYLENEETALLVEPNSPEELVGAILRMIQDENLRRRIIKNAYQVPQSNTIEIRSKELVDNIGQFAKFWHNSSE